MPFKYTRASVGLILHDLKVVKNIVKYVSLAITLGFYIYTCFAGIGILPVNIALASVIAAHAIFEIVAGKTMEKNASRTVHHVYRWAKITLKTVSLGAVIYGMYVAAEGTVKPLAIVWATIAILLWVGDLIVEFAVILFEREQEVLLDALEKDVDEIKDYYRKPAEKVSNFFNHVIKGEPIPEKEEKKDSRALQRVKKWMEKRKAERKSKKEKKNENQEGE